MQLFTTGDVLGVNRAPKHLPMTPRDTFGFRIFPIWQEAGVAQPAGCHLTASLRPIFPFPCFPHFALYNYPNTAGPAWIEYKDLLTSSEA